MRRSPPRAHQEIHTKQHDQTLFGAESVASWQFSDKVQSSTREAEENAQVSLLSVLLVFGGSSCGQFTAGHAAQEERLSAHEMQGGADETRRRPGGRGEMAAGGGSEGRLGQSREATGAPG